MTSSGDKTVKVWDFAGASCAATFSDHTQPVWDVSCHHTGDFVASCSMDHTVRLWDFNSSRCRQTFRGHVDSVNSLCWQPYSNNIITGSGDKTVSLWDARSGLCVQTFYGHLNAVSNICVNTRGDIVGSCDADGVVKMWDVRMIAEMGTIEVSPHPVNMLTFDRSAQRIITASDDCMFRTYNANDQTLLGELRGHEDAVHAVSFVHIRMYAEDPGVFLTPLTPYGFPSTFLFVFADAYRCCWTRRTHVLFLRAQTALSAFGRDSASDVQQIFLCQREDNGRAQFGRLRYVLRYSGVVARYMI